MKKIETILEEMNKVLWELNVKTEFNFEPIRMNYKAQELYKQVLVDNLAPYYFTVIKESKYAEGLDELKDKYRASIEYQSFAYNVKDYDLNKAQVLNGIVKHFADYRTATRWLRDRLKENFVFTFKN